jgi:hypothetical protein
MEKKEIKIDRNSNGSFTFYFMKSVFCWPQIRLCKAEIILNNQMKMKFLTVWFFFSNSLLWLHMSKKALGMLHNIFVFSGGVTNHR